MTHTQPLPRKAQGLELLSSNHSLWMGVERWGTNVLKVVITISSGMLCRQVPNHRARHQPSRA